MKALSQKGLTDMQKLMIGSDSVVLTSHLDQYGTIKDDGTQFEKRLVIKRSINMTIVKEIKKIDESSIAKLANIILNHFQIP